MCFPLSILVSNHDLRAIALTDFNDHHICWIYVLPSYMYCSCKVNWNKIHNIALTFDFYLHISRQKIPFFAQLSAKMRWTDSRQTQRWRLRADTGYTLASNQHNWHLSSADGHTGGITGAKWKWTCSACVCVCVLSNIWTIVHQLFIDPIINEATVLSTGHLKHCSFQYLNFVLIFILTLFSEYLHYSKYLY